MAKTENSAMASERMYGSANHTGGAVGAPLENFFSLAYLFAILTASSACFMPPSVASLTQFGLLGATSG